MLQNNLIHFKFDNHFFKYMIFTNLARIEYYKFKVNLIYRK